MTKVISLKGFSKEIHLFMAAIML